MKKILLLSLTLIFAAELEVDGNLKVTGNVDVQNNPIKNVGPPTELTDAINGNALQDALRDDTSYEYKMYMTKFDVTSSSEANQNIEWSILAGAISGNWNDYFHDELNTTLTDGWSIDYVHIFGHSDNSPFEKHFWVLKRPLADE